MSNNTNASRPEKSTQDMLVRLMAVARLLTHSNAKKKNEHRDTKPGDKTHDIENL